MLALKTFRDKAAGLADLLNWSHLVDSGVVLCKDGALLAGWFYRAPDIASSTDSERNWLSGRVNAALARLGAGWASWIDTVRLPSSSYPAAELSHFPDPISRLVDAERRAQFLREGTHYEGEYAIVVQFTPPLRRRSKVADLIYACGGRHYDVAGEGAGPAFCPLSVLETGTDMAWAEDWIATCFELQAGRPPVPHEREAIHRAMLLLRSANDRTLTHFVAQVQDEAIRSALRYYTLEGTLGRLLDAEEDGLADAPFLVFEIEDLMAMGERNLIPVLLYLFRRFERSLTGQPAYLLLDEAWVMLGHPTFRAKIREWLKVLRKANCAVVLATQSLSDAGRSGILDVLIESCPTKIFLPNEEAGTAGTPEHPGPRDLYEAMGLNETQIDIIRTATKKRHYYLVSPEGRRLFDLGLGPIALSFAGISSKEQIAHLDRLAQREGERWPFAWLEEQGMDYAALQ